MNFASAFLRTLPSRPWQALTALYWRITGRKVRANNQLRLAAGQSRFAYPMWIDTFERNAERAATEAEEWKLWITKPHFTLLLIDTGNWGTDDISHAIQSIEMQCYPEWRLLVVQTNDSPPITLPANPRIRLVADRPANIAEAISLGISQASGDYIISLSVPTTLPPTALLRFAKTAINADFPEILYGDHDKYDATGHRHTPWFKPRWNQELFFAQDYISDSCAILLNEAKNLTSVHSAPSEAIIYSMLLEITKKPDVRIHHIPFIQAHIEDSARDNQSARTRVVSQHLKNQGVDVTEGDFGSVKLHWPLPEPPPLVSIIIPTRDKVELLRTCVNGILKLTEYPNFEVIIVDNGSINRESIRYFGIISNDIRVRIIEYDYPYNYSAINNFAVPHTLGTYLCLLNNDTEIVDGNWLSELMRYAVREGIGAVGAKLVYSDRTIQHAGVVVGLQGAAGHAHRFLKPGDSGYFARAHVPHYVTAVTAACLVVEKQKFEAVGGLDEESLKIAFNDVDFCLKLERAGWHNVYAPQSMLIHHESKSRGKDFLPENRGRYLGELEVLQKRWGTTHYDDPLHHPSLSKSSENFIINLKMDM